MARSQYEFTYVLYLQKNLRQRGSTDCSLARQIFSLIKDTQVKFILISMSFWHVVSRKKIDFPISFPETLTEARFL